MVNFLLWDRAPIWSAADHRTAAGGAECGACAARRWLAPRMGRAPSRRSLGRAPHARSGDRRLDRPANPVPLPLSGESVQARRYRVHAHARRHCDDPLRAVLEQHRMDADQRVMHDLRLDPRSSREPPARNRMKPRLQLCRRDAARTTGSSSGHDKKILAFATNAAHTGAGWCSPEWRAPSRFSAKTARPSPAVILFRHLRSLGRACGPTTGFTHAYSGKDIPHAHHWDGEIF
jgi:hypothetical protein